jgi:hypothetical protein
LSLQVTPGPATLVLSSDESMTEEGALATDAVSGDLDAIAEALALTGPTLEPAAVDSQPEVAPVAPEAPAVAPNKPAFRFSAWRTRLRWRPRSVRLPKWNRETLRRGRTLAGAAVLVTALAVAGGRWLFTDEAPARAAVGEVARAPHAAVPTHAVPWMVDPIARTAASRLPAEKVESVDITSAVANTNFGAKSPGLHRVISIDPADASDTVKALGKTLLHAAPLLF